ncbi:putative ribonuclease H-like domain-containing protein [Tanacetum coccineum]
MVLCFKVFFGGSQLEIHGVGVSTEDANQKFLRSLPSSWSQVSLVMRTKPGVDSLSIDDLYNNLRVFESDIKGSTGSSSSTQNVAFVSSESTNNTNDVSTAYGVSTSSGYNLQRENSSSYTEELMYSFFVNQSSGPHLDHEDLESSTRRQRESCILMPRNQLDLTRPKSNATIVTRQGILLESADQKGIIDINQKTMEGDLENRRNLKLCNSGSDTKVISCSKECVESYAKLKKLYDEQREQLDDKTDVLTYHKKLLAEVVKEKEELKTKLENFQSSSKGLSKLLNSQMSKRGKYGIRYGDQIHDGVLSYENEVFQSVFDSRSSDVEDSPMHDRFTNVEGMHVVPPPMIGNYMPSGPNREVDDSMFTYGPKQSKTSESDTQTSNFDSRESNSSVETLESVPEPAVVEPKVVSQPKVWSDASIIEEYESDSDDEYVIQPLKEQERPSFAFVKHVKTPRETVKEQNTYSPSPKADKRDWNGLMSKRLGLGYGFTKKACFVCGSFSHLIRDCDFHEKRMVKQVELNKKKGKGTGQGENKPVWNNVQRLNHQNQFVSTAVLTRTGRIPVNATSHNSQAVSTSAARKVNAVRPIVNENRPRNNFHKSHSPIRRPFNRTTTPRTKFSNQKVNTAEDNPQRALKNKGIVDSGCLRHMTGNKAYLVEYQDYNGGPVAFGGSKGYITGKGKIKIGKLDFEDVCFVKELHHFNVFSMSQMCDKKNKVLFTDTEYLVLSSDFKLPDENQVLLRIPRQNNMYSFNLENIVPSGGLACLIAKATIDESNKWHRRKATQGLLTKDETSGILKDFIRQIENQLNQKVKTIRCDNGTEFKNRDIIEFCGSKGIKREYSNARTPQQNGTAERKNRTLIEAARTMLTDSFLPNTFWAEAISTACYVLNRVLVTKPQNKTPYELITGKIPIISYIRPFGCHVTILNTIDHLGKFEGKSDEGFLVGYSLNSKAFRPVRSENQANKTTEADSAQDHFVLPIYSSYTSTIKNSEAKNEVSTASSSGGPSFPDLTNSADQDDSQIPVLEDIYDNPNDGIFTNASYDDEGAVADFTNFESTVNVSPIPTSKIHYIHPTTQILRDPKSAVQTRSKKISEALEDESWVDAMQEELLQFKIQKVWILVDLPYEKKAIRSKWVYRNKKDERGVVGSGRDSMESYCVTREVVEIVWSYQLRNNNDHIHGDGSCPINSTRIETAGSAFGPRLVKKLPDIMFAVLVPLCGMLGFSGCKDVNKLGFRIHRVSLFDWKPRSDSDYADGEILRSGNLKYNRSSVWLGEVFFGERRDHIFIRIQCKKETIHGITYFYTMR